MNLRVLFGVGLGITAIGGVIGLLIGAATQLSSTTSWYRMVKRGY